MKYFYKFSLQVIVLVSVIACTSTDSSVLTGVFAIKAQESSVELFGETFERKDSRVVAVKEIKKIFKEWNYPVKSLPVRVQEALVDDKTIGLLVTKIRKIENKASKISDTQRQTQQRLLVVWESSDLFEGFDGYWLNDDDGTGTGPCPGGRPYCDYCSGCKGKTLWGTESTCLCTNSCKGCRDCPNCIRSGGSSSTDAIQ